MRCGWGWGRLSDVMCENYELIHYINDYVLCVSITSTQNKQGTEFQAYLEFLIAYRGIRVVHQAIATLVLFTLIT